MTVWGLLSGGLAGALAVFILGLVREKWRNDREGAGPRSCFRAR